MCVTFISKGYIVCVGACSLSGVVVTVVVSTFAYHKARVCGCARARALTHNFFTRAQVVFVLRLLSILRHEGYLPYDSSGDWCVFVCVRACVHVCVCVCLEHHT